MYSEFCIEYHIVDSTNPHKEGPMDQNLPTEVSHAPDSTTGVTDEESDSELEKSKRRNKLMVEMDAIEDRS